MTILPTNLQSNLKQKISISLGNFYIGNWYYKKNPGNSHNRGNTKSDLRPTSLHLLPGSISKT